MAIEYPRKDHIDKGKLPVDKVTFNCLQEGFL